MCKNLLLGVTDITGITFSLVSQEKFLFVLHVYVVGLGSGKLEPLFYGGGILKLGGQL